MDSHNLALAACDSGSDAGDTDASQASNAAGMGGGAGGSDAGAPLPRRDCDATHPNVGQSAEFVIPRPNSL